MIRLAPLAMILVAATAAAQTPPRIVDVNPSSVLLGGFPVEVIYRGSFASASLDGVAVAAKQNGEAFDVTLPPHAAGPAQLKFTAPDGQSATFPIHYVPDDEWDMLLLPVTASNLPGAEGSLWSTDSQLWNSGDEPVDALKIVPLYYTHIPAGSHRTLDMMFVQGGPAAIYVPRWALGSLAINSRVEDLSRQAQTWGTELPVVRAGQFATSVTLINIPADARFRSTLRIYSKRDFSLTARIVGESFESGTPLFDITGNAFRVIAPHDARTPFPTYMAIGLDGLPNFASAGRVRLTITADEPIWAFVSVTNNETQHVTLMTPQPR